MFKKAESYSYTNYCKIQAPIGDGSPNPTPIGILITEVQVSAYNDLQLANSSSLPNNSLKKFIVEVTQKVRISNIYGPDGNCIWDQTNHMYYFENYPAILDVNHGINLEKNPFLADVQLLGYSPKTVNSQVQQSLSASGTNGSSRSNTSGSSTSETNSYGVAVSLDGISANAEHSSTTTTDQSATSGSENSREGSASDSMTIKDWGSYVRLNTATGSPTWRFGQESPWDAINFKYFTALSKEDKMAPNPYNSNQFPVDVPQNQENNLFDSQPGSSTGFIMYPPSQLSTFGVSFVVKAKWLISLTTSPSSYQDPSTFFELNIDQLLNLYTASQVFDMNYQPPATGSPSPVQVFMDDQPLSITPIGTDKLTLSIDMSILALDPLSTLSNSAIVGFAQNKFSIAPAANLAFMITSIGNNLAIWDTTPPIDSKFSSAFSCPDSTGMEATLSNSQQNVQMTMYFKVVDTENDYILYLKHWIKGSTTVMLTFTINSNYTIIKYVDATEGQGGEANLMAVHLRNQDFASVDYHDYLNLGLNSVQIAISPLNNAYSENAIYHIRAVSIEKN